MNLYGFASGDPVNFSDPMGLCPICALIGIGVIVVEAAPAIEEEAPVLEAEAAAAISRGSQLAQNLARSGQVRRVGEAAHHIVARAAAAAQPARDALQQFGVEVDEAVNGVVLPAVKGYAGQAANHLTLHTAKYYQAVNDLVSSAQSREDIMSVLSAIKSQLLSGKFPP